MQLNKKVGSSGGSSKNNSSTTSHKDNLHNTTSRLAHKSHAANGETDMAAATASPEPKGTLTPPGSSPLRAECDPNRDSSHGSTPPSPEAPPTPDSAHMATEPTNHSAARFQPANDTTESRLLTNQEPLSGAKKRKAAKVHKVEMECGSEGEGDIAMAGSFNCPVCQEELPDQHEFTQHIRKHNRVIETDNGTKVYCCGICKKQLSSNSSLDRHMLVHSGERPFRCHICGTHFTTNGNMHRHIRGHYRNGGGGGSGVGTGSDTGESDLGSEEGVSCPRKRSLEEENTVSAKSVRLNTIEVEEEELTCPACGVEQPGQHALEQHVETIHPEYQVACNKCQVGFKNYRGLHLHNSMVHPMSSSSPPQLDLTLTDFSSPKFPLIAKEICENSSRQHDMSGEEGQGLHRCHLCNITFPCAEAWLMHMREHTASSAASPPFRCPRCVMRFSNLAEFAQHQQRHLCEDPQPPKESFLAVLDLLHNRDSAHANVASLLAGRLKPPLGMPPPGQHSPAPADSAKASPEHPTASRIATTASATSVSSTMVATAAGLSHDEQFAREYRDMKLNGQYPCRLCKDVFANLRKLKSHNLVHMLAPPYRCNLCSFYSNDKNTLKEHMKSHKGDTPYECNICNLAFTTKANCERHIKNIHGRQSRDEVKGCMSFNPQESSGSCDRSMETVCHICHIDCKARSVLRDHIRSSHPEGMTKPFSCKLCGGTFSSENDVMRHVIQQHPEAASGPTLETLVANRSSSENLHEHHDLTPVESLLNFSKLPMGVPLTTHQSPSTSLPVTFPHKSSAPAPLIPSRPPTPTVGTCHTPSSSVLPVVEDDTPLDLSISKRDKDTEEETNIVDEEEVDVETGDIKIEQTEPEDLSKPRSEHIESDGKETPPESIPESTTDVLKIPKPPFPLGAMYPQPLSLCPPFSSHQYPLFMPPYGGLHPVHNFDPALLEEYQKELKRGLQLTSGGGLLSATSAFLPNSSPSFPLSALALAAAHRDPLRVPRPDLRSSESKSDDSLTDNHNSSKSGDDDVMHFTMRNSVLMKKPKQRRYRTERPWRCDLCDKGFTLRSNMERHMKQQHPDIWQQRPRGLNAQRQESTAPSVTTENSHTISDTVREQLINKIEKESAEEKGKDGEHKEEEERELVIDDNPEEKNEEEEEEEEEEDEEDEEDEDEEDEYDDEEEECDRDDEKNQEDCSADLASVHKLLSAASSQSFPCFGSEGEDDNNGDNDSNSNNSSGEPKRSAYSSAPQKQKCPFCQRKFPWSSSLVRHIRTHTGQKPYLCPVCRFPFTTKSNCDRHLLRKHPDSPHTGGGDRPYRCRKCPGAAFTSLESLRKHEMFKHEKASDTAVSRDDSRPFRCHVCEVPLATREVALQHLDGSHPEHSSGVINAEPVTSDNNNDTISVAPDSTTTDRVSCMFCLQRCWSLAELKQHVNSQHTRASSPVDSEDDVPKDECLASPPPPSLKTEIKEERKEESEGTDFISNLLGTKRAVVDHLLTSKSADDAAKLLGVR
ncbi:ras-responsive element-binding protein 1 isoform X2 [Macrobrachium rosenbergii]